MKCRECKYIETRGANRYCTYHDAYVGWHGCEYGESKPQTNYDRINSKTPEELADFFGTLPCCPPGSAEELCYPENTCGADTKMMVKCWMKWLKSPVEDK